MTRIEVTDDGRHELAVIPDTLVMEFAAGRLLIGMAGGYATWRRWRPS
jgi:hypothetical protein